MSDNSSENSSNKSDTNFSPIPIQINQISFKVAPGKNLAFWEKVNAGAWEPSTYKILDDFVFEHVEYIDLGAWIGSTLMYAAQIAKRSFAFEPDPLAFEELQANLDLNSDSDWVIKTKIHNIAVAPNTGSIRLGNRGAGGDSTSSVLFSNNKSQWEVKATTLEDFFKAHHINTDNSIFIKMDIEGGEYELIPRLRNLFNSHDIALFISIHPEFLNKSLLPTSGNGIIAKVLRRLIFVWQHIRLVSGLPFKYYYFSNGMRINIYRQVITALVRGDFLHEIVCSNRKWEV
ncbi:MAG: FkbM family methyltransferase [Anaerolineales bacterium]